MKPIRVMVVLLLAMVLAFAFARGRAAHATSSVSWQSDMSYDEDCLPPSRPSVKLVAVRRAEGSRFFYMETPRPGMPDTLKLVEERSSSADLGCLELRVWGRDDRTLPARLGWRARVVAGTLPRLNGVPVPTAEYLYRVALPDSAPAGSCTIRLFWKDQEEGQGDHRASLHAGIVLTCLDRARNESEPSDTVWIDAPAR